MGISAAIAFVLIFLAFLFFKPKIAILTAGAFVATLGVLFGLVKLMNLLP